MYYFTASDTGVVMALTFGLLFEPIPLGAGKLGFNFGFDFFTSDTPVEASEVSDPDDLIGSIVSAMVKGFAWGATFGLNSIKMNLGVNYTLEF